MINWNWSSAALRTICSSYSYFTTIGLLGNLKISKKTPNRPLYYHSILNMTVSLANSPMMYLFTTKISSIKPILKMLRWYLKQHNQVFTGIFTDDGWNWGFICWPTQSISRDVLENYLSNKTRCEQVFIVGYHFHLPYSIYWCAPGIDHY